MCEPLVVDIPKIRCPACGKWCRGKTMVGPFWTLAHSILGVTDRVIDLQESSVVVDRVIHRQESSVVPRLNVYTLIPAHQ